MLEEILKESARRHNHLCPRQMLGARMALYACELLGLELPRMDKRLLVTSETDGCAVDGIIRHTLPRRQPHASNSGSWKGRCNIYRYPH